MTEPNKEAPPGTEFTPNDVSDASGDTDAYKIIDFPNASFVGFVNEQGAPEGHGYLTFHNGDQHQGSFKSGKAHGPGVFLTAKGAEYDGQWEENKRVGDFKFTNGEGAIFKEKYNPEGKCVGRKKTEEKTEPAKDCWVCGRKARSTFNNPYACRKHRGTWKFRNPMKTEENSPGIWSCCMKDTRTAPGCEFLEHNINQ